MEKQQKLQLICQKKQSLPQVKFKIRLLNDNIIQWLYRTRTEEQLKTITASTAVEEECCSIRI
jgi:hypothetical protein